MSFLLRLFGWLVRLPTRLPRLLWGSISRTGQNIATALIQIRANTGRSILTTLGIVIAVMSIIVVVSFVEGFGNYMTTMLRGYGTQYMIVYPYTPPSLRRAGMRGVTLDVDDVRAVGACKDVRRISPFVFSSAEVKFGKETAEDIAIRGVAEHYQTIRNFFVDEGRFFGPVDIDNGAYVCVLGRTLLKLLHCNESVVGEYIRIDDMRFKVIGLLEPKGSFFGEDQDQTIIIPYTTAIKMYPNLRDSMPFLAEAESEDVIALAQSQIRRTLRQRHNLTQGMANDFIIRRQDEQLREFENVRNLSQGILAGIVSISLLVGGIGIMNVCLVSVTERTREIGLRKSVGARRRDIMMQFLTESIVLCTLGGAVGVGLGFVISQIASLHPKMVEMTVPMWSVALGLGFSAGTGLVFGLIPAFKAAIMHQIDALRHE